MLFLMDKDELFPERQISLRKYFSMEVA